MATITKCILCGREFENQRSTARYCTRTCQQRAYRQRKAAEANAVEESKADAPAEHSLVKAVRVELDQAGVLTTWRGQVALQLARRLADPEASSPAAMADKLGAAMVAALGPTDAPVVPDAAAVPELVDDEVTRARKAREDARQAAGRS